MPEEKPKTDYFNEDDLKYILSLPRGRSVIWRFLQIGGFAKQPFVPGDQSLTDFNCGNMNTGLVGFAECLAADPTLTAIMLQENNRGTGNRDNTAEQRVRDAAVADRSEDSGNFEDRSSGGDLPDRFRVGRADIGGFDLVGDD